MSLTVTAPSPTASWRPALEVAAVAATATAHLAWPLTDLPRAVLVLPLVAAWFAYLGWRARVAPAELRAWGFRREGLLPTVVASAAVLAVGVAAFTAFAWVSGEGFPPATALITVATYPVWGLLQQALLQGLVTGNLAKLPGRWGHTLPVTLASATLFSLVHWPQTELMVGTFLLGLAFSPIWLRWRNVWPLGVVHGWLGVGVFYVVMGQDPVRTYFLGA